MNKVSDHKLSQLRLTTDIRLCFAPPKFCRIRYNAMMGEVMDEGCEK